MRGELNLEILEQSSMKMAEVWRYVRANPDKPVSDIASGTGAGCGPTAGIVQKLRSRGWMASDKAGRSATYRVKTNGTVRLPRPEDSRIRARKQLSAMAKRAEKARRSAITIQMSKALAEIEVEARRIRDGL